jgi:hypothetical protein
MVDALARTAATRLPAATSRHAAACRALPTAIAHTTTLLPSSHTHLARLELGLNLHCRHLGAWLRARVPVQRWGGNTGSSSSTRGLVRVSGLSSTPRATLARAARGCCCCTLLLFASGSCCLLCERVTSQACVWQHDPGSLHMLLLRACLERCVAPIARSRSRSVLCCSCCCGPGLLTPLPPPHWRLAHPLLVRDLAAAVVAAAAAAVAASASE